MKTWLACMLLVACGHPPHGATGPDASNPTDDSGVDGTTDDGTASTDAPADAASATDCTGCNLVLFGGFTTFDVLFQDTWIFDGSWTLQRTAEPDALADASAAMYRDRALVFGGQATNQMYSAGLLVYRGQWGSYDQGPAPRAGAAVGTLADRFVVFGGANTTNGLFGDTWVWGIDAPWKQLDVTGPSARHMARAAVLGDELVLFGGYDTGPLDDTWIWDGSAWTAKSVVGPSARAGAAMATLGNTIVLFGGYVGPNTYLSDTWTWDGAAWTQHLVPGPTARSNAAIATVNGKVVLFGGYGSPGGDSIGFGALGDTWTWDGTTWSELTGSAPPARSGAALAAFMP